MSADPKSNVIQDALARAKQIAAKLQASAPSSQANEPSRARPGQDVSDSRKRTGEDAGLENGGITGKRLPPVTGNDPKKIAMQAAATIAQKAGLGSMVVVEIQVPNRFVGLIIGRGGEMINKLQSESSARIQVAPDPGPGQQIQDRNITITGTPQSVEDAKKIIHRICEEGKVPEHLMVAPSQPGEFVMEHLIPASKVGLVIGKGGETIRNLQERAGCRMVMIQDGQFSESAEKPLRITGDQQRCQYGKQLVVDLLTEKELEQVKPPMDYRGQRTSEHGAPRGGRDAGANAFDMPVPSDVVGFVIGKQGETIKKIQEESGCRVQFKQPGDEYERGNGQKRMCTLTGEPAAIERAQDKIREIIEGSMQRGGPPRPRGPPLDAPGVRRVEMPVPAERCGIIIGKGGENIREICRISGAHVEINKSVPDGAPEKSFVIRGDDQQIEHAQQLINEKLGEQGNEYGGRRDNYGSMNRNQQGPQQGGGPPGGHYHQQPQMTPPQQQQQQAASQPPQQQQQQQHQWGYGGYPQQQQQQPPYQQQQQPQQAFQQQPHPQAPQQTWQQPFGQQPNWQQQPNAHAPHGQPQPQHGQPQQQPAPVPAPGPTPAPAVSVQQAPQPGAQPDYSAAWAQYYQQQQQYYAQQYAQPGAAPVATSIASVAAPVQQAPTSAAQPDYSAAWASYYQSLGYPGYGAGGYQVPQAQPQVQPQHAQPPQQPGP